MYTNYIRDAYRIFFSGGWGNDWGTIIPASA